MEMLQKNIAPVSEIAFKVGFGSPAYFNTCFHEYFGYPPGEVKKREPGALEPVAEIQEQRPVENVPKGKRMAVRRMVLFTSVGILILLSLTWLFYDKFSRNKVSATSAQLNTQAKSIAVLPFIYLSNEHEKQYLADGTMDAILLHLSKIKDLRVMSRTSVEQYRKSNKTVNVIGLELDMAYLLEGSFQKEGDKARLILQLIRTSDGNHVWSNKYDREWKDIFAVQSEVAETIASELQAAITPEEKQLIQKLPTTNLTAYDFYQRGRDEFIYSTICKILSQSDK
jgi:TolB-like protein